MLNFLEKITPKEVKLFLFVPKECRGKYSSKRISIYESPMSKYSCFLDLRRFCRKNNINRIFSLGALPQEGFIMALASMLSKTELVCHLVVNPFTAYKTGFNKPAIKAFFEFLLLSPMIALTDKFYVPIRDIYEKSKKSFFFAQDKIDFLPYPLDSDIFIPQDKIKIRKKLSIQKNKKVVLYVGRIEFEKGSDIILKLAELNQDILFILIGQLFDKNIGKNKLENIKILSPQTRESLVNYYNAADLCIFPSRSEAGPSAAREAMACGTQVILPNIMGPRVLSPPAIISSLNSEAFNEKITDFFNTSKEDKKMLSEILRKFVIKDYSYNSCKSFYIEKLLKQNGK